MQTRDTERVGEKLFSKWRTVTPAPSEATGPTALSLTALGALTAVIIAEVAFDTGKETSLQFVVARLVVWLVAMAAIIVALQVRKRKERTIPARHEYVPKDAVPVRLVVRSVARPLGYDAGWLFVRSRMLTFDGQNSCFLLHKTDAKAMSVKRGELSAELDAGENFAAIQIVLRPIDKSQRADFDAIIREWKNAGDPMKESVFPPIRYAHKFAPVGPVFLRWLPVAAVFSLALFGAGVTLGDIAKGSRIASWEAPLVLFGLIVLFAPVSFWWNQTALQKRERTLNVYAQDG